MSQTTYSFDAAAARLNTGRNTLIRRLRELGLIDGENMPVGRERRGPHFQVRCRTYQHPIKGWTHYARTEITPQGLDYIAGRLGEPVEQTPQRVAARQTEESKSMTSSTPTRIHPLGTLHDAGEFTVVTQDGDRTHHRAAMVVVFETVAELQQAINAHRCAYEIRRDIPEEQLHPELTAQHA